MARELTIAPYLSAETAASLRVGEQVQISGELLTARDAACQRMVLTLAAGGALPVDLQGRVIYTVGPTPAKPGQVIGSAGPTTATRLMPYLDAMLEAGMQALIGKGDWPPEGAAIFRQHGGIYLAALGGAAATIAKSITAMEVVAYDDLGPEAIHRLTVERFPAVVAIDVQGNNLHEQARRRWRTLP